MVKRRSIAEPLDMTGGQEVRDLMGELVKALRMHEDDRALVIVQRIEEISGGEIKEEAKRTIAWLKNPNGGY